MYNYYTYEKKQKEIELKKKEEATRQNWHKLQEKRIPKYVKKYEKRIKNFIYQMADSPILFKEENNTYITTRENLFKEESGKILDKKGFVFSHYEPNKRTRLAAINCNYNNNWKYADYPYISQPKMQYKPRTDPERIYETINSNGTSLEKSKYTINNQLNQLSLNEFKKSYLENDSEEEERKLPFPYINDLTIESKPDQMQKTTNFNTVNTLNDTIGTKKNSRIEKKKLTLNKLNDNSFSDNETRKKGKRIDNSKAKQIHEGLYRKTYFKALEHYPLFRGSCFLPTQKKPEIKDEFFISTNYVIKRKPIKTHYDILENNKNKKQIDFIDILTNLKVTKEHNLLSSMDNIDQYKEELEEKARNSQKETEKDKMNMLKRLAFSSDKKVSVIQEEQNNNITKSNNRRESLKDLKLEEKVLIDGVSYSKKDFENIGKKVLEKCNWMKHKLEQSDPYKSGSGKMMFTNGMTVSDFMKKYNLNNISKHK